MQVLLSGVSRGVVLVWIAVALLASTDAREPAPERVARLEPMRWEEPEEPPAPEPERETPPEEREDEREAEPPEESEPEPLEEPPAAAEVREPTPDPARVVAVDARDASRGGPLLDGAGAFPPVESSYSDFGSFLAYARAMEDLGARFVVVRSQRIVGRIDVASGQTGPVGVSARFSPRARDYSGEPALAEAARSARARYGPRAEVMMLVPRAMDAALFGAIARELEQRGSAPGEVRRIQARYRRGPSGGVALHVDAGQRRDGSTLPLGLIFDLSKLAGHAAGA